MPASISIVNEGNVDLNEYPAAIAHYDSHGIENIGGKYYNFFPIGTTLIALPVITGIHSSFSLFWHSFIKNRPALVTKLQWLSDAFQRSESSAGFNESLFKYYRAVEHISASFIAALCVLLMYLISCHILGNRSLALVPALLFAFGTSMWSTSAIALWQHGPSILMLTTCVLLLLKADTRPSLACFAAIPLAMSFIVRPTNSISVAVFTVFMFFQHRRYFAGYFAILATVLCAFVIFNLMIYGKVLPSYFFPNRVGAEAHFLEALVGNLFSPGRGLFVFSPVLLFALYGIYEKAKAGLSKFEYSLISIVCLHLIVISSFPHWWGGHSYGPRFMSDMLPYLMYFVIIAISSVRSRSVRNRLIFATTMVVLGAISVFIHYRGANYWDVFFWNTLPINIDLAPYRVWGLHDLQFLRGLNF